MTAIRYGFEVRLEPKEDGGYDASVLNTFYALPDPRIRQPEVHITELRIGQERVLVGVPDNVLPFPPPRPPKPKK